MFLLLCGAGLLYLLLGDLLEGAFLALMVVVTIGMTLYQESKTERALQALRSLGQATAMVLRDGARQRIAAAELVRGDVVELEAGVRVPADCLVLSAQGLMADESALTGESVPVRKLPGPPLAAAAPGGDDQPWVYSGTLLVQGHGIAEVAATGPRSVLGRIGTSMTGIVPPRSPLQEQTGRLARRFAIVGLAASLALALLLGLRDGRWLEAMLAGTALAIALLPEEFTVILAVFPALGAWRLARASVLTRRLNAIETLGATSVLCVDKTGTLTENRMALHALWHEDCHGSPAPGMAEPLMAVLRGALLATPAATHDPLELALLAHAGLLDGAARPPQWVLQREYAFTTARRATVLAWRPAPQAADTVVAIKGAPESVIAMCRLSDAERAPALEAAAGMARRGLRVLAVGQGRWTGDLPAEPEAIGFHLLGMCALADPLRPDIPAAVAACRAAGLRLMMITGDHPETAHAIAAEAGLDGALVTGRDIDGLDDTALTALLADVAICARVLPEQKLAIVRALQRGGAVVAMTGDGINDAPALEAADVGIAMGLRGTDVAREAAALTLLDDRFASIVDAVAAGRRIFGNMRKAMAYVAAVHVPIAGMALLPGLFGWPVMLAPVHIVFLELVIDPACAIVFENEPAEPDQMRKPPRPRGSELFGTAAIARAVAEGAVALAMVASAYWLATAWLPEREARACGFAALVLVNLGLLLMHRSRAGSLAAALGTANRAFWVIVAGALGMLAATLYAAPVAAVFRFDPPGWSGLALAALPAVLLVFLLGVAGAWSARAQRAAGGRRPGAGH
jgi:Ca2+-transporting ATPase